MVTGKVKHPYGLGSLQQAYGPSYLREAQEESRRRGLLSRRGLASSGEERKREGSGCGSGPPTSACTENALGCAAASAKIWVCSRSDFPPGLEVQVREQGKDGGQESQRCFEESETPEGFALATFLFVTHPAESCALRVSLLVPGRLPFGPALH